MKYAIVFDSKTGNTAHIAGIIRDTLKQHRCVAFGQELPKEEVDVLFLGSWCDKGGFSETMQMIVAQVHQQRVALFATCGFGMDAAYFRKIADHLGEQLPKDNMVVASFVCQGKLPQGVLHRYEAMLEKEETQAVAKQMIRNYEQARTHPDEADEKQAEAFALRVLSQCG